MKRLLLFPAWFLMMLGASWLLYMVYISVGEWVAIPTIALVMVGIASFISILQHIRDWY